MSANKRKALSELDNNNLSEPSRKKKRTELDIEQKREIISFYDENSKLTQQAVADHFTAKFKTKTPIARTTICELIKKENTFLMTRINL
jgi:hypothetical protein